MFPNDMLRERIGELGEAIAESQRRIAQAHLAVQELRVTVRSPDGGASLELDGTGGVRGLVFHDDGYRDLEPDELSALIVDLFTRAQADVRAQALGALPPSPVTGLTAKQLLDPETDLSALVPQDLFAEIFDPSRARRTAPGDDKE